MFNAREVSAIKLANEAEMWEQLQRDFDRFYKQFAEEILAIMRSAAEADSFPVQCELPPPSKAGINNIIIGSSPHVAIGYGSSDIQVVPRDHFPSEIPEIIDNIVTYIVGELRDAGFVVQYERRQASPRKYMLYIDTLRFPTAPTTPLLGRPVGVSASAPVADASGTVNL